VILAALVTGGHRSASVGFAFPDWPWWRYFLTQAEVICHYLRLSLVPWPLVLDYDWRAPSSWVQVAFPCLFVAALVMMTVWGVARRVPASFAGAWFLLILAPTSSVLPIVTEVAVEHRMYLPLASVLALGVMGGYLLATRPPAPVSARWRRSGPAVGVVMAAIATLALGWLTYRRNDDYHNYDRIWADTIAKRPHNARARNNYATSLLAQGRFAEAEPHLVVAIGENPVFVEALANLGVSLSAQGRVDAGIPWLERAIALRPGFASAHRNLGEAFALQHRLGAAASEYVRSLSLAPDDVSALNRAAWILATAGDEVRDGARARGFAERAVRLTRGEDAASLDSLGAALAEVGEFEAAIAAANQALLLARRAGDEALSNDLRRRLQAYAQRKAFREP
jgi:Tfp pilus assembly protein PilF